MSEKNVSIKRVPKSELTDRMCKFTLKMNEEYPDWELCTIVGSVNMFYLTGTIQDSTLFIKRDESAVLFVRRSYERATLESEFDDIRYMSSFREITDIYTPLQKTLYLDMSEANMQWFSILSKYMPFKNTVSVDSVLLSIRSEKSKYEIDLMRRSGKEVERLIREEVPRLVYDGITEAELGAELFALFIKNGHHGISRFSMHNVDPVLGHIGFGSSSLYPSVFNGASGQVGLCPAAPVLGSHSIKLSEGDLIYVDVVFGKEGYHTDKTIVFSYLKEQSEFVKAAHSHCLELEQQIVSMLKPGAIPSEIYESILSYVRPEFINCFMGAKGRTVPFIGHGIGLYVDEWPVLAKGFDNPLRLGMTLAVEPKIGIEGVGIVGSENTYLITEEGSECITGKSWDIILC